MVKQRRQANISQIPRDHKSTFKIAKFFTKVNAAIKNFVTTMAAFYGRTDIMKIGKTQNFNRQIETYLNFEMQKQPIWCNEVLLKTIGGGKLVMRLEFRNRRIEFEFQLYSLMF